MRHRLALGLLSLMVLLLAGPRAAAERFTIAVIPDTQYEITADDGRFAQRLEWLVGEREALNLKMVLHSGDLADWDTPDHKHFVRASEGMGILDKAKIPYAIAVGNHDTAAVKEGGSAAPGNVNRNLRNTTTYNAFFPAARFLNLRGVMEEGRMENAWHEFSAGGLQWLVINLELWPREQAVAWARDVAEKHPRHNVILLTHSYLTGKGELDERNGGYGDNSPAYIFKHLVEPAGNVRLVFSGHTGNDAYLASEIHGGRKVHQFLQCYHAKKNNPVRLLTIDSDAGEIETWVYAPLTGEKLTDGSSRTIRGVEWVR
jgi:hypothetical protein